MDINKLVADIAEGRGDLKQIEYVSAQVPLLLGITNHHKSIAWQMASRHIAKSVSTRAEGTKDLWNRVKTEADKHMNTIGVRCAAEAGWKELLGTFLQTESNLEQQVPGEEKLGGEGQNTEILPFPESLVDPMKSLLEEILSKKFVTRICQHIVILDSRFGLQIYGEFPGTD